MPPSIDPQLMLQLLETFRIQLDERLQVISEGVLRLEHDVQEPERGAVLNAMFRACHNIKGAARGVGLLQCAELSHLLESLFAALRDNTVGMQPGLVDLCLQVIDIMPSLVLCESREQPLPTGLEQLMALLQSAVEGRPIDTPALQAGTPERGVAAGSVRLPVKRLDLIAARADELQVTKIRVDDHLLLGRQIADLSHQLRHLWSRLANQMLNQTTTPQQTPDSAGRHLLAEGSDLVLELHKLNEALVQGLRTTVSQMRPLTVGLREDVRNLRMVPAETVLRPMERMVRDIAQAGGKQVELILLGAELEMDRAVLDALRDPLTHLLRNAVDHGLESGKHRRALGKPETGRITIQLTRSGGLVNLSVYDDGRGIDRAAVRARALNLGLAAVDELNALDDRQLLDYLFRPGFSTRSKADQLSGRGVGLDVVRVNLQAINGHVSVSSRLGEGTRFMLDVPFTLAGDKGLVVRSAGQLMAIPSQYVQRILEQMPDQIGELEGEQTVMVDGEPVPLRSLAALMGLGESRVPAGEYLPIVVINRGWRRMALLVDRILEEREMVVKPLSPPLHRAPKLVGGALGRDGGVVLVLEVRDLFDTPADTGQAVRVTGGEKQRSSPRILVVDDSITTRTLEVGVLESAGYRVDAAVDGADALEKISAIRYDLVVSDVEMPGMNGFELTRVLRQDPATAELPVIIVTSLGSEEDRRRGVEVKASAYIVKSEFDSRQLLEVVEQLV